MKIMAERFINVLAVPVKKEPKVITIANELAAFQKLVGGYIEVFRLDRLEPSPNLGALAILNEEGKITPGIKPNRKVTGDVFYGDFLICGFNDEGDFTSVTPEQEEYYTRMFALKR